MSEFIKIKNDTGDGDMLLKTGLIFRVYDKSDGGANIVYGGKPEEATVFRTASTAAEVLAAIEGAQTVKGAMSDPVMAVGGGNNGIGSYGPGDILYSTGEVAPHTRLTKLDPDTLAVVCAGQMLARELEIRTGDKWKVTAQPMSIGFYFALEWGEFKGKTHGYGKRFFAEMEDGKMAEWAQEVAEEMAAKALREMPIDISSVGDTYSSRFGPFEGLDSLIGKEPAPYPLDCTCRNLISGHDLDCPWHGG